MNTVKCSFLAMLFCLICSDTVFAQLSTVRLEGKFLSTGNEAIEHVTVLLQQNDSVKYATVSNSIGEFSIANIRTGEYTFMASRIGFAPYERNLAIASNIRLEDIILRDSVSSLPAAVISAETDRIEIKASGIAYTVSDADRRNATDAFDVLKAVPLLLVDPINRTLSVLGDSPLVLVNGIKRDAMFLRTIIPKDVVKVEVILNPSSRYLFNGTAKVVNLTVKERNEVVYYGNLYAIHNYAAKYGVSEASLRYGGKKISIYTFVQNFYFRNNEYEETDDRYSYMGENTDYIRRKGKGKHNTNMNYASVGMDFVPTEKSFFTAGFSIIYQKDKDNKDTHGDKYTNDVPQNMFEATLNDESNYYSQTVNLYYETKIGNTKQQIATGGSYNRHDYEDIFSYEEASPSSRYENKGLLKNAKESFDLEVMYVLPVKIAEFTAGFRTYRQTTRMYKNDSDLTNYDEWKNYLYAGMDGKIGNAISYQAGAGIDLVSSKISNIEHDYLELLPSASISYKLGKKAAISTEYSRQRNNLSIDYLNPYNTSIDSLNIIVGNPRLTPYYDNRFTLRLTLLPGKHFLSSYLRFVHTNNYVGRTGYLNANKVYVITYDNIHSFSSVSLGINARIKLWDFGSVSGGINYAKRYMKNSTYSNDGMSAYLSCNLSYRKFQLFLNLSKGAPSYSIDSKVIMRGESSATLSYLPVSRLKFNIAARWLGGWSMETYTRNVDYSSFSSKTFKDRNWMLLFGASFYFQSKKVINQRQKLINNNDEGVNMSR